MITAVARAGFAAWIAVALVLAMQGVARAHTGGTTGFASIAVQGDTVRYSLTLWLAAVPAALGESMRLAQPGADPDLEPLVIAVRDQVRVSAQGGPCAPASAGVAPAPPGRSGITVTVEHVCAEPIRALAIRDDLFDVLGSDYHTLAHVVWPGGSGQFTFEPERREARFALDATGAGRFFALGVEHVFGGSEHVLLVLALALRGGNLWSLLAIVTAFTLGHSASLALGAVTGIGVPEGLVAATMLLGIAYVAAENVILTRPQRHRWIVAAALGLLHGAGLSALLHGLPGEGRAQTLMSFNLGVEAGQVLVVGAALPLLLWLRRYEWEPRAVAAGSLVALALSLVLLV